MSDLFGAGYREQAMEKLDAEYKAFKGDKYQSVMKGAVLDAVKEFVRQNEEFAQAVAQGGSFAECMAAVSKDIKSSLSDIEAYRRAAAFYFDGAKVRMELIIQLEPAEAETEEKGIVIDLTSFL